MSVIKKNNIKVNYKDIHEGTANLQKLVQDTGRRTVPCMYINNEPMHESADIMKWLEKNLATLTKA